VCNRYAIPYGEVRSSNISEFDFTDALTSTLQSLEINLRSSNNWFIEKNLFSVFLTSKVLCDAELCGHSLIDFKRRKRVEEVIELLYMLRIINDVLFFFNCGKFLLFSSTERY
jgi:hypothetical protein